MKKPQTLIGLLAALGTAIGVLVAVLGLPYGRADYTAFAELYHGPTDSTGFVHVAQDCEPTIVGTQNGSVVGDCERVAGGTQAVDVTLSNSTGVPFVLGTFNYRLNNPDDTRYLPPVGGACGAPAFGCNPDFNGDPVNEPLDTHPAPDVTGSFSCAPPPPDNDTGLGGPGTTQSFISCFNGSADGPVVPADPTIHMNLATTNFNVPVTALVGSVPLTLSGTAVFDGAFTEVLSCNPIVTTEGLCFNSTVKVVLPAEATATNTVAPTNTPPPTATFTPVPPDPAVVKVSEWCTTISAPTSNADCDADPPTANLFICETGLCDGKGEGNLIVFEYARNVLAGEDLNTDPGDDGLGAYEFDVEYDNFVIATLNPCDMVFSPTSVDLNNPGGSDGLLDPAGARGPVDEVNGQNNPYCTPDVGGANNGTCTMSVVLENVVHFGCVTNGQNPDGPTGSFDIAALNLIPHEDLADDLFPGNDNGVVTIIKDNGCELVSVFGHPVASSVNGGLTPICGNLAVTIRILEGDIDLDCEVELSDAQAIALRYGGFFGSTLYSKWFDLEPNLHDLDIDIKDLQKVFGRIGSTCENPVPPQPPVPFN